MWVEKTPAGKYKYVEQYTDYMTGKKKRVSVTLDKDTAAAKRNALQILSRMIEQRQEQPEELQSYTLRYVIEKYLESHQQTSKQSTYLRYRYQMQTLVRILDPDALMNRLTANYFRSCFIQSGKSANYLNNCRSRLRTLINWAYQNDYISSTDCIQKFKPFKGATTQKKIQDKYLEADELKKLLAGMDKKKWALLTRFLALSGMRIGEAMALNVSDLDFSSKLIHVNKTYNPNTENVTVSKTSSSIRDVYMQPELEQVCKEIILNTRLESLSYGFRSSLLFCGLTGKYIAFSNYNKYLKKQSERLIGRKITAHALRHTHASLLLASGVDIDTISRRLGHKNSQITREIYLHVTEKLEEKDRQQIKNANII